MQGEKRLPAQVSKGGTELRMALVRPTRTAEVVATTVAPAASGVRMRMSGVHVEVDREFDGETLLRVLGVLERRGAAR
jgi:hypothetical protein